MKSYSWKFCLGMFLAVPVLLSSAVGQVREPAWDISPDYVTRQFQIGDGLPSGQVRGILQTSDGYLWVATLNGLARFDGVSFKVFNSVNTPELRNSLINCLFIDREGRLWIGSATGEISWLDETGFHALTTAKGWPHWPVVRFAQSAAGEIWALNSNGYLLRIQGPSVTSMLREEAKAPFSEMSSDTNGQIWLMRKGGQLARLEGGQIVASDNAAVPGDVPRAIAASRVGGLWICDGNRLRRWFEGRWAEDRGTHSWSEKEIVHLYEDSTGRVWVGTRDSGVFIVGLDGNEVFLGRLHALRYNEAENFCEDREQNMWVGSEGGGMTLVRHRVATMVTPADRWQQCGVTSVAPSRRGGVWVGTDGAGVYHYDGNRFTRLAEGDPLGRSLRVRSVMEAEDGTLWVGTIGDSLQQWKDGRFSSLDASYSLPSMIYAAYEDTRGALWFGTQNGVRRFSAGVWTQLAMNLSRRDVRNITETPDGTIWIGMHGGGIARYQSNSFTRYSATDGPPNGFISALSATRNGDVWMGVESVGLVRWREGKFAAFTMKDGLPSDFISHIDVDSSGHLWVASRGGIFRVSLQDLERRARGEIEKVNCVVLDESEGLRSLGLGAAQPTGCQTADGRLWFATSEGLAMVDPARIRIRRIPPPVIIESVSVEGRELYSNDRRAVATNSALLPVIEIPPGGNQVEFNYTALSLEAPQRVRFKYRMEGLDKSWQDLGTRRSVLFSRLMPGDYTFRVIACNNYGYWNEEGASMRFRILPHFWQAWWFAPLCWFAGTALVAGIAIGLVRQRHRRRLELLQRAQLVERERTRIAQDLHDDLGTGLTEITTNCALAQGLSVPPKEVQAYLGEISQRSLEIIAVLDEIVWAVNPKNDNLSSMASFFCHFAGRFLESTPLRARFDVEQGLPPISIDTQQRHHLFLAFKEALNNAVKHSGGTSLKISIFMEATTLCIDIVDDGSGLVSSEPKPGADGLLNMQSRLQQLGGTARIISGQQGGTRVEFRLPLVSQGTQK